MAAKLTMRGSARPQTFFLTWIEHRRTRELSQRLGIELVELITPRRGPRRYAELIPRTLAFLRARKPGYLLVQSPSLVLAAFIVLLRPFFGYRIIFDAHNEAVEPYVHPSAAVKALTYWLLRKADRVIVSNQSLAKAVIREGGTPIVLWDPLPSTPRIASRTLPGDFRVLVVSTYAPDEPFAAVVAAARNLPATVHFYVTGNPAKLTEPLRARIPSNMTLTGYLAEDDYWATLAACDVVLDLTTMDNCLVCGAYEAIVLSRPLVLSNNEASRDVFAGFAEFVDNSPAQIVEAITGLRSRYPAMLATIPTLRADFENRWRAQAAELRTLLGAQQV